MDRLSIARPSRHVHLVDVAMTAVMITRAVFVLYLG